MLEWIKMCSKLQNYTFFNVQVREPYDMAVRESLVAPSIVAGHFVYLSEYAKNLSAMGHNYPAWIQVLRQPAERTISHFYYALYGDRSVPDKIRLAQEYPNITLEKCIAENFENGHSLCRKNTQTTYLCGRQVTSSHPLTRDDLIRAKHNLEYSYAAFGLTEHLDLTRQYFAGIFPEYFVYPLTVERMRANDKKEYVSQSLYKRIVAFNHLDEELYKFALTLFEKRIKEWRRDIKIDKNM